MSEYYLADRNASQRAKLRLNEHEIKQPIRKEQEMKVTLLGDFLFPTSEPQGCDPYNSTHGKSVREAWRIRRARG
jgi:hypothetical protein